MAELPEDSLTAVERLLYHHFRYLDCPSPVDPVDTDDCACMAAEVIRFLTVNGVIGDDREAAVRAGREDATKDVNALVAAAWAMCVEEQQYNQPGWSTAKSWAWDNLRVAVEPFLDHDEHGAPYVPKAHREEPKRMMSTMMCAEHNVHGCPYCRVPVIHTDNDPAAVDLAHYSAALDEIYALRAACAAEAALADSFLRYKTLPAIVRAAIDDQVRRLHKAARGNAADAYAHVASEQRKRLLEAAGAPTTLTRDAWEAR